jgi:small subunit ribosomal protein S8
MINDLIADSLTRIRNAAMRRLDSTTLMHSKTVEAVVAILADKGYIESFNVIENGVKKTINVVLKYDNNGRTVINEVKRVSKPGLRRYCGIEDVPRVLNGLGIAIISTSKGVITDKEAKDLNVGGEILCYVY